MSSSEIYASAQDLRGVYTPLRDWLIEHGSLETGDGREITGTHLGLPVVEGFAPDHSFKLDPVKARQYAPIFADVFEIGRKGLELNYCMPCYYTDDFTTATAELIKQGVAPMQFDTGGFKLYVPNPDTSAFFSRSLKISPHDETFLINNWYEVRIPGSSRVKHEQYDGIDPGQPHSVTYKEYLGLVALTDMLHTQSSEELQQAPGWEQELPNTFRPEN